MKLIIFGAGRYFRNRKHTFEKNEIIRIVDNDESLWGMTLDGIEVISPMDISAFEYDFLCLMVASPKVDEIRKQIYELEVPNDKIISYDEYLLLDEAGSEAVKRVLVWGTGLFFSNRKTIFQYTRLLGFIDSDIHKNETVLDGRMVMSPEHISEYEYDYLCIMTNPRNADEIKRQLQNMQVDMSKVVSYEELKDELHVNEADFCGNNTDEQEFFKNNPQPGISLHRECMKIKPSWKPLITVITPYYNAGKYFEQTFNCVINQTFPWFEWIIVDDGTTNKEDIDVLDHFAKKDARIRVVHQKNGGLADARNKGFEEARTEIVVQIDADDLIAPQYVEYVYWGLYFNPDAAWAYTWSTGFGNLSYLWHPYFDPRQMIDRNDMVEVAAIRKSAWKEIGGYKVEAFLYNEDWRFWLEQLSAHNKPVSLGGYLCWYRRTDNGMLSTLKNDIERDKKNEKIIHEAGKNVDTTLKVKHYPVQDQNRLFQRYKELNWDDLYEVKHDKESDRKVLMIFPWIIMGGADKFQVDLVRGLSEKGYEVSVVTLLESKNEWSYQIEEITDEVYHLPHFLEPQQYLGWVEYYIRSRGINAVMVSNTSIGYHMLPFLRMRFPQLLIFDYVHMEEWYWRAGGHARTSGVFSDISEKTFVCNSLTKKVMVEKFGCESDKVTTMYIGVDENHFDPSIVPTGILRKKLHIKDNRPIVLFPCRIHQQKRPLLMVEIARQVIKKIPDCVFAVVGDGPQMTDLKKKIREKSLAKHVVCIGRENDMRSLYRDATLTLICSLKEGLALTAYESLAMGVPVISSDVGGQRDLIDDSVGKLIPCAVSEEESLHDDKFDEEEIIPYAEAIVELLSDKNRYQSCVAKCREKILNGFTIHQMVENMDQEIMQMLSDEKMKEDRKALSKALSKYPKLVEEMYTLGCMVG